MLIEYTDYHTLQSQKSEVDKDNEKDVEVPILFYVADQNEESWIEMGVPPKFAQCLARKMREINDLGVKLLDYNYDKEKAAIKKIIDTFSLSKPEEHEKSPVKKKTGDEFFP